jgi:transposase
VRINHVDRDKLDAAVKDVRVVLGIDIAKDVCFGRLVTEQRQVLATVKWHQLGETAQLLGMLRSLPAARVEVALEPSGTYGDALRYQLEQAGLPVCRVSGKRCHDAAEVYDGVPSMHDAKAADIVARLHLDGASERWRPHSDEERALSAVVQTMVVHDEQRERTCCRLEAVLARHWPELTTELELGSATMLSLLATYGGPQAVAAAPKDARALMQRVGGHYLSAAKVERVIESAGATMGVPMVDAERRMVTELAAEADRSRRAGAEARKRVQALSAGDEELARTAPLVGQVTAAVLKVKVGSAARYGASKAYVKAMGLNLKERSSGTYKGQLKLTKRGPGEVRRYLYLASLRMIRPGGDEVVRAWYLRKVRRDGGRIKKKAVAAVMRKLAAALWHVGRGEAFDSSKLFDTRRLGIKQVQSAEA